MGDRLVNNLIYNFGSEITTALEDDNVIEIMVNPDGSLWIEKLGEDICYMGKVESSQSSMIISLIASHLNTTVTTKNPIVEGELPDEYPLNGCRFEGLYPPIVKNSSFTIRKKASRIIPLEEYAANGSLTAETLKIILTAIKDKQNILVIGGTSSGKTTLVNGIIKSISEISPHDRIILIEDTAELQSSSKNSIFLRATPYVTIKNLVRATMRLRPDRILVGEVRGGEALDLLKAWNTGHPGGVATIHADSAKEGLFRIEELISESSTSKMSHLIGTAIDLLIFIQKKEKKRVVSEIAKVIGYDSSNQNYLLEHLYNERK